MALAKLSACAAGGALIGGGAVHVAEAPATARPQYAKQAPVQTKARRHIARPAAAPERKVRRIRRVVTRPATCEPQQMAMVPTPTPYVLSLIHI